MTTKNDHADLKDWLAKWDANEIVWSIEMGGLGPGYEQAIQVTTAEIARHLVDANYDVARWTEQTLWTADRDAIEKAGFGSPIIKALGLSGAQWGVALSLATNFYRDGIAAAMSNPKLADRKIQVTKYFPAAS